METGNNFSPFFFEAFCAVAEKHIRKFDSIRFIHLIFNNAWPDLHEHQRILHVRQVVAKFLPRNQNLLQGILHLMHDEMVCAGFGREFETCFHSIAAKEKTSAVSPLGVEV